MRHWHHIAPTAGLANHIGPGGGGHWRCGGMLRCYAAALSGCIHPSIAFVALLELERGYQCKVKVLTYLATGLLHSLHSSFHSTHSVSGGACGRRCRRCGHRRGSSKHPYPILGERTPASAPTFLHQLDAITDSQYLKEFRAPASPHCHITTLPPYIRSYTNMTVV